MAAPTALIVVRKRENFGVRRNFPSVVKQIRMRVRFVDTSLAVRLRGKPSHRHALDTLECGTRVFIYDGQRPHDLPAACPGLAS